jgi:two-component system, chemotaxis family, CheB/CheR fusion protein
LPAEKDGLPVIPNCRILAWNSEAVRMYGWSEAEAMEVNIRDRVPKSNNTEELTVIRQLAVRLWNRTARSETPKNNTVLQVWITSTALLNEAGIYAIATTERPGGIKTDKVMEAHNDQQGRATRASRRTARAG